MRIGLTGGIASGKSLVSSYLKDKGYPVVDADIIAKRVVEPASPALDQIKAVFGQGMIDESGQLDRKKLGSVIFSDQTKREQLNKIVHPFVRSEMKREADEYEQNGHKVIFLDIPLLIENKLEYLVDQTWVVYVDQPTQLNRLITRDQSSEEEALQRISAQQSLEQKKAFATIVIDNRESKEETYRQVDEAIRYTVS
ncbi:dephospho-CoA kinase [Alkalihalobacillus xiaoxiensis]|uniref:Dephospho-CoA kinase n=1 Tax=Shouchella xiaoxiensis TaxID=766895 RepID=A0ABS2STZ3_9BACI|nr:dephospho-CoA kinase [Shouchella xiaoxiensis]MBM7838481.1 dephospho-CoA kinase [Shouchella xiaoxiensis]